MGAWARRAAAGMCLFSFASVVALSRGAPPSPQPAAPPGRWPAVPPLDAGTRLSRAGEQRGARAQRSSLGRGIPVLDPSQMLAPGHVQLRKIYA